MSGISLSVQNQTSGATARGFWWFDGQSLDLAPAPFFTVSPLLFLFPILLSSIVFPPFFLLLFNFFSFLFFSISTYCLPLFSFLLCYWSVCQNIIFLWFPFSLSFLFISFVVLGFLLPLLTTVIVVRYDNWNTKINIFSWLVMVYPRVTFHLIHFFFVILSYTGTYLYNCNKKNNNFDWKKKS